LKIYAMSQPKGIAAAVQLFENQNIVKYGIGQCN
jgi:hypothetical protein